MFEARRHLWMTVLALAALTAMFAPAAQAGEKLVVQMDEPFEIAGQIYPAGKLSVRSVRDYSPVARLHEIQVDGQSLGLLVASKKDAAPSPAQRNVMTFQRGHDGRLILVSVAEKGQVPHTFR